MSMTTGGGPRLESTLSGLQQLVAFPLQKQITGGMQRGATPLKGPLFSAEEEAAYGDIGKFYQQFQEGFGETGILGALQSLLSGEPTTEISEEATKEYFQKSIADPLTKMFMKEILPQVARGYKGFTTRRGKAMQRATQDWADTLASEFSKISYADEQARRALAESAAGRRLSALPMAGAILGQPYQMATGFGALAERRQTRRLGEEFRMMPEANPWLQMGMGYLGTPMTQMVSKPAELTGFGDVIAGISAYGSMTQPQTGGGAPTGQQQSTGTGGLTAILKAFGLG